MIENIAYIVLDILLLLAVLILSLVPFFLVKLIKMDADTPTIAERDWPRKIRREEKNQKFYK